jgi:hypothetical protein
VTDPGHLDRSRYRRVRAPMLVRPVGPLAYRFPRNVDEARVGGLRAYSDEEQKPGRRLELEVFFPDQSTMTVLAEVAWVDVLPEGSPARFDVGLRYVTAEQEALGRIAQVLADE